MQIASLRDEAVRGASTAAMCGGRRVPTSRAFPADGDWSSGYLARGWWRVRSRGQRLYRSACVGLAPSRRRKPSGWRPELGWSRRVDRPATGRSSSSACRRWLRWRRRRGSATTSIGVRGVRSVRASTFAASRRVEAIRAASCCQGERLAGRRDRPPGCHRRPGIPRLPRNRGRCRRASFPAHNGRTFPVGGSPGMISDSRRR